MHLGGIGTGNFEIGVDGQLTTWQLFNTLRDGEVPFHFAVKTGAAAKLLQTAGGPDWPRVQQIEMTGEYPFAMLRFRDPDLPVQLELDGVQPVRARWTRASPPCRWPCFVFRIQNPTTQTQTVSLAALMQNPVGYEAAGQNNGRWPTRASARNVNEPLSENGAAGLFMRAEAGARADAGQARDPLHAGQPEIAPHPAAGPAQESHARGPGRAVAGGGQDRPIRPRPSSGWRSQRSRRPEPLLRAARQAVQAGATLLFSGKIHAAAGGLRLLDRRQTARRGQPRVRTSCSRTSSTAMTSGRSKAMPSARSPPTARCRTSSRCPAFSARAWSTAFSAAMTRRAG